MEETIRWLAGPDGAVLREVLHGAVEPVEPPDGWRVVDTLEASALAARVELERSRRKADRAVADHARRTRIKDELIMALGLSEETAVFLSGWRPE